MRGWGAAMYTEEIVLMRELPTLRSFQSRKCCVTTCVVWMSQVCSLQRVFVATVRVLSDGKKKKKPWCLPRPV